ncbi:MAG: hypothetical protein E6R03_17780 [Hyphomicrobiaceae bacterium]|nr:MAG: hypothetical protein E6R03_17780 [Hyphomicrobiaceae bacterium]
MNKPNDVDGCFDASNCSTAIKVLQLLRNGLEKSETTARARAANMEGVIRSQWIVKANTIKEVIDLVDNMTETIPTENPYANCKSFNEVCKVFIEEDHEMRKFFGKDKSMKTWTLKQDLSQPKPKYIVIDENGKLVCARNNQRDAVVSALRIAKETNRGAVQLVGE